MLMEMLNEQGWVIVCCSISVLLLLALLKCIDLTKCVCEFLFKLYEWNKDPFACFSNRP